MRTNSLGVLLLTLILSAAATAETVEVDVQGLTCGFCVDNLQRRMSKLPDIQQVDVSLKSNKVRIVSSEKRIDIDEIRGLVIDSGFTPGEVRIIEDDD